MSETEAAVTATTKRSGACTEASSSSLRRCHRSPTTDLPCAAEPLNDVKIQFICFTNVLRVVLPCTTCEVTGSGAQDESHCSSIVGAFVFHFQRHKC